MRRLLHHSTAPFGCSPSQGASFPPRLTSSCLSLSSFERDLELVRPPSPSPVRPSPICMARPLPTADRSIYLHVIKLLLLAAPAAQLYRITSGGVLIKSWKKKERKKLFLPPLPFPHKWIDGYVPQRCSLRVQVAVRRLQSAARREALLPMSAGGSVAAIKRRSRGRKRPHHAESIIETGPSTTRNWAHFD